MKPDISYRRFFSTVICNCLLLVGCSGVADHRALVRYQFDCDGSLDPKGKNDFTCVDNTQVTPLSYCLRASGHDPVHVRQTASSDIFLTGGKVTLGVPTSSTVPDSCASTAYSSPLQNGDWLMIAKASTGSSYQMQILRQGSLVFKDWIPLNATGNGMYLTTPNVPGGVNGFDWFVMLGDDEKGGPRRANMPRIEKYYFVEIFPNVSIAGTVNNWNLCLQERPDFNSGSNFNIWTKPTPPNKDTCAKGGQGQQLGQGSGGQNWP